MAKKKASKKDDKKKSKKKDDKKSSKKKNKKGKKMVAKRKADAMLNKEWYDVVAPLPFESRRACKTLANKSRGMKRAEDSLKGRIFEVNLADLQSADDAASGFRKISLRVDDVRGRSCLTAFHGCDLTTDKLRSLVKKRCSLIEAAVSVKTSDGYMLRVFIIGFTKRVVGMQVRRNCYAQSSQEKDLRKKIMSVVQQQISRATLSEAVNKFMMETVGEEIKHACASIYPLRDVFVRKVKLLKVPKFDAVKLLESHGGEKLIPASSEEHGAPVA